MIVMSLLIFLSLSFRFLGQIKMQRMTVRNRCAWREPNDRDAWIYSGETFQF